MSDEKPVTGGDPSKWYAEYAEKRSARLRAELIDPDHPAARVAVIFTTQEAAQLSFMAEAWLDGFPPVQVYDAEEAGVWNKETVRLAMRKLDAGLWPKKKRTRAQKPNSE